MNYKIFFIRPDYEYMIVTVNDDELNNIIHGGLYSDWQIEKIQVI